MKRILTIAGILIIALAFTSCSANKISSMDEKVIEKVMSEYKSLKELPETYDPELATANGDVVTVHSKSYNVEKLDKFMSSLEKKEPAMVRITHYTIEGDAIIRDLIYDGKSILLKDDNTRDKFAAGEDRKIIEYKVSDILITKRNNGTEYSARIKNGDITPIVWINSK